MAKPVPVPPVKLIAAILFADEKAFSAGKRELEKSFGAIDYQSEFFPFDLANYYEDEMGTVIYRTFVSFEKLIDASCLADIKLQTNAIERSFEIGSKRTINIDSGYLDFDKLVLASMKKNGPKIYIGKGVWADMNLLYSKGQFQPFSWTFADFADGRYSKPLIRIREIYKAQLKLMR